MAVKHEDLGGQITEQALADLRARIGAAKRAYPTHRLITFDVGRRFAQLCLATDNPLYTDLDYGASSLYGDNIAPPMTEIVSSAEDLANAGAGLPGVFGLHAGDHWTFSRHLRLGETLRAEGQLVDVQVRPSKWGDEAVWQQFAFDYYDEAGTAISRYSRWSVRADRRKTKAQDKYKVPEPYVYSDDELDQIWTDYDAESIRGGQVRNVEDVTTGDSVGHVVKGPVLIMDMMAWWMGSGGPFVKAFGQRRAFMKKYPKYALRDSLTNVPRSPEDAHFDSEFAVRSGVGAMYDIGRMRTASVVHLVTNWMGDAGRLCEVESHFRSPNYIGDTTWYRGTVTAVEGREVTIEVEGTNQHGRTHTDARAVVELPSRTA